MNDYMNYVGIDISKNTLDCSVLQKREVVFQCTIANSPEGLKTFNQQLKSRKINTAEMLLCCEHTGLYTQPLLSWCAQASYPIWVESALAIKRSLGLTRGKNDQVDAERIATYAYRFRDKCRLSQPPRKPVAQLSKFLSTRTKLIKIIGQIETTLKENKAVLGAKESKAAASSFTHSLTGLKKDLAQVEKEIKCCIREDRDLSNLNKIITSVDGIGAVTASHIIVATQEFTAIQEPKKLACHAGVVPFDHSSGVSIRKRPSVSRLANKQLKQLLHMAALSASRNSEEMHTYYQRKVTEGKAKMSVLNAIRNKLIHRIYACVRDNRLYEKIYTRKVA